MKKAFGFTLIELMIAVAVVAILAAVALPSYQGHLRKTRRSAAQAFMADIAQREQARFLAVRSYAAVAEDLDGDATCNENLPGVLSVTAPAEVCPHYAFAVTPQAGPPVGFTVTARAMGAQDWKDQEDLRLCSPRCPGVSYEKARGDITGNTWYPDRW